MIKKSLVLFMISMTSMIYSQMYDNKVEAGVYVTKFYDFNIRDNEVSAEIYVWFNYPKVQPFEINYGTDTVILNAKSHNPGPPLVLDIGQKMHATITYNTTLICDFDVKNFPFDRHQIKILIRPPFDEDYIQLIPDLKDSSVFKEAIPSGWIMTDFRVSEIRRKYDSDWGYGGYYTFKPYSVLEATIEIRRDSAWGVFLKTFFQLFIAFVMAVLTFLIPRKSLEAKFGLSVGAIFIVIGSQYMIGTMLPDTPVATLTDKLHIVAYLAMLLCVLTNILTFTLETNNREKAAGRINTILFFGLIAFYLITNGLLMLSGWSQY